MTTNNRARKSLYCDPHFLNKGGHDSPPCEQNQVMSHAYAECDAAVDASDAGDGELDAMDVIQKIGAFADSKNKKKYSKTLQTLRRNAAKHEESVKAESGKLMKALKDKYTELKAFDDDVNETMMGDLKDILDYFERLRNDLRAYKEAVSKAAQYTSEASSTSHAEITALVSEGERQVAVLQAGFQASQTGIDSELE